MNINKKSKPRIEQRDVWCGKCGKNFVANLLVGVPLKVLIAALELVRCPKCHAHRKWIHLL